jgi:FkbM family methyltransferase
MLARARRFVRQDDVRRHLGRALYRRARWRWHWWRFSGGLFEVRSWDRGLAIRLSNTGSSAQVYYRTHSSPALAHLLATTLVEGMCVLDVGAHVGEYTLLAASAVGPSGRVYAVEPQPELAELIRLNAASNGLSNITVQQIALDDHRDRVWLASDPRSGGAHLGASERGAGTFVESVPLATLLEQTESRRFDFTKLDAAGNELAVLRGASKYLAANTLPRIAYKLYNADVVRARVGHDALDTVRLLFEKGYRQWVLLDEHREISSPADVRSLVAADRYSVPVMASLA